MKPTQILTLLILCYIFRGTDEMIYNNSGKYSSNHKVSEREIFINKVSLTQNGYIQFLKYINDVPPLTEYTFCIWMRSNNLTNNHPILSYSKHEEERLIRMWIGARGKKINLEILGNLVFEFPVYLAEKHWNHICQSWSSHQAIWTLFINGKQKATGSAAKLRGTIIKGGGDIVVGQEYTDFDKGLDDGIEGDISGFNFVLSSSLGHQKYSHNSPFRRKSNQIPQPIKYPHILPQYALPDSHGLEEYKTLPDEKNTEAESAGYNVIEPKRNPKGILDLFRNLFSEQPTRVRVLQKHPPAKGLKTNNRRLTERFSTNEIGDVKKTLGLLLVELSFDCGNRKGAPLSGKGVLINWNQSPVRVFGGAILKSIPAFCYVKQ